MYLSKSKIVICLLTLASVSALCQNVYKKKVVSYVPTVLMQSRCGLDEQQVEYISSIVGNAVRFARFDYAPLPNAVFKNFNAAVSNLSDASAENVRPIIEQKLAPELLKILDINKELLSKQNLSEVEQNTFLATKAQAAGLTADELQAVLNSGFLYIPYVEYYHHSIEHKADTTRDKNGKITGIRKYTVYIHEIKTGLLWYKLNVAETNTASISFVSAANGWNDLPVVTTAEQDEGATGNVDEPAFEEAVKISATQIGLETKKIDEFKLTGEVEELTTFGLKFNLGTREGIGLDDSYWVDEMQQTQSGTLVEVNRGFVKVRDVGNNTTDPTAKTYAQVITGTNYSQGLSVKEIPLLGVNTLLGAGKIPINISTFDNFYSGENFGFGLSKDGFGIRINSETNQAYGPVLDFQADLANNTGISELWLDFGGALGWMYVDGQFYLPQYGSIDSSTNIGVSWTGYAHMGLLKKFYFRRFGLIFQGDVKYAFTRLWADKQAINGDTVDISMTHGAWGVDGRAGLEIYLTPTSSIGAAAEYSFVPSSDSWSVRAGDTKNDSATGPKVKHIGLGLYIWINHYF